ncbi:hypothetical protein [uncultured Roseobacter sp.]|nr:hypothetical protein [uncultured Roseobacter sp.]
MKTNTRFIKSITETAAQLDAVMPWACTKCPTTCHAKSTDAVKSVSAAS